MSIPTGWPSASMSMTTPSPISKRRLRHAARARCRGYRCPRSTRSSWPDLRSGNALWMVLWSASVTTRKTRPSSSALLPRILPCHRPPAARRGGALDHADAHLSVRYGRFTSTFLSKYAVKRSPRCFTVAPIAASSGDVPSAGDVVPGGGGGSDRLSPWTRRSTDARASTSPATPASSAARSIARSARGRLRRPRHARARRARPHRPGRDPALLRRGAARRRHRRRRQGRRHPRQLGAALGVRLPEPADRGQPHRRGVPPRACGGSSSSAAPASTRARPRSRCARSTCSRARSRRPTAPTPSPRSPASSCAAASTASTAPTTSR